MKKFKNTKILLILALLSSLLFFVGCEDDETTSPDEVVLDGVDILLINVWDKFELQEEEDDLIPVLAQESALEITKHDMKIDGVSVKPEDSEIYFEDNQIYLLQDDVKNYLYDYYYNRSSKALWLLSETTETNTIVDSLGEAIDPLNIENIDIHLFDLYFVSGEGPKLTLLEPGFGYNVNTLEPEFTWNEYIGADEYNIVCAKDSLFENIVFDEVEDSESYTFDEELDNFTDYFWKVKADNSVWSDTWQFTTNYVVSLINPQNDFSASLRPHFTWNELDGASVYTIQVSQSGDFDTILYENSSADTYFDVPESLEEDNTYYWRVKTDTSGENWSEIRLFHTDILVTLSTPADGATEIDVPVVFSWVPLDNANNYRIQVASDEDFEDIVLDEEIDATTNPDSWTENNILTANIDGYYWRMTSDVALPLDLENENDNWSEVFSFTTNAGVLLNSPEDEAVEGVIVKFDWEEYPEATEYQIQVATDNAFSTIVVDNAIIEEDGELPTEFIPETDFDLSTTYYWRIKDVDSDWSEIRSFTTKASYEDGTVQLTFPMNDTDDDVVKQIPQFIWERFGRSDYYRIQISDSESFENILITHVGEARSFIIDEEDAFDYGEVYYWRVRSEISDWSEVFGFRVKTAIPDNFEIDAVSAFKVDLTWDDVTYSETGFAIERSDSENGPFELVGISQPDYNNFVDYNLNENSTYYYRGRTYSQTDTSAYWQVVEVQTTSFVLENEPELISVSAGTFSMGSDSGDADENPVHDVTISNDFEIGKTEITNAQFVEIINWATDKGMISHVYDPVNNPITYNDGYGLMDIAEDLSLFIKADGNCKISFSTNEKKFVVEEGFENHAVTDVTWFGAALYANILSEIDGLTPVYDYWNSSCNIDITTANGYHLPTEAEWEYTAKYNDGRTYPWGNETPTHDLANFYNNESTENGIAAVGSYSGDNALGIQDLAGNVWEWCNDAYSSDYYGSSSATDPMGPETSISTSVGSQDRMVIRGGSWEMSAESLRNANRSMCKPRLIYGRVNSSIGFRIAK